MCCGAPLVTWAPPAGAVGCVGAVPAATVGAARPGDGLSTASRVAVPKAASALRMSSPAEAWRSAGFFAIPLAITSPSSAGRSGFSSESWGGGSDMWAKSTAASVVFEYGTWPVRHSKSTPASAYTSLLTLAGSPCTCSGEM